MGDSYRIRTELGVNKTINITLDQEYEFLEILSLKLQQTDIYTRDCSNYGVLVGRVTANNGFGIPNARVSIFVPLTSTDQSNPIITSIYPYKSPEDKNEDGYRYNLLPYEKSYSTHSATGTLPSRLDVLTGNTAVQIYDTYYKYTTKTNDSGDYMIMGVPLGAQTIVMDLDLSDIGEFSLTPQDLIRLGLATESQVAGSRFRTSNDLSSLPQIINLTKTIEINPFWGDETLCQAAINRLDFDLRDDANIDIQPTSIFMGSMFSTANNYRIRRNSKPKDNFGNLCSLTTGPGQILAIRQTIQQDSDGNPILEEYNLEQSGNVIDGNGTWLVELPMNLDYVITNEFGEKVISYDPEIGIPTKAKYRFKIKWQQSPSLTEQVKRAYFLVPNVKEYGWTQSDIDINYIDNNSNLKKQQRSSYYFGISWSGYTDGFVGQNYFNRLNEVISCEDTFYEFRFNKVYSVSQLIDQYKRGGRGKFIGIKEINDNSCESTINKFPVNEGFQNFDIIYFLFSLIMVLFQLTGYVLLVVAHFIVLVVGLVKAIGCALCNSWLFGWLKFCDTLDCDDIFLDLKLPMITYPDCQACQCDVDFGVQPNPNTGGTPPPQSINGQGVLSYVSLFGNYTNTLNTYLSSIGIQGEDIIPMSEMISQALAGNNEVSSGLNLFKTPKSRVYTFQELTPQQTSRFAYSTSLPIGERINIFNTRKSYFDNLNRVRVTFDTVSNNTGGLSYHYDNTLTLLSNTKYEPGTLLTSVSPVTSNDINFLFSAVTDNVTLFGISGTTIKNSTLIDVKYANPDNQLEEYTTQYILNTGSSIDRQIYPIDREYFQVVTAITVADAVRIWNANDQETFPNIISAPSEIFISSLQGSEYQQEQVYNISPLDFFQDIQNQYILIIQRGVDPYSPKYKNEFRLGRLFGKDINDSQFTITADTRLNIPIQKLSSPSNSVQPFDQSNMFYTSYFFTPGDDFSAFTTTTAGYYGAIDSSFDLVGKLNTEVSSFGVLLKVTSSSNLFWDEFNNSVKYDLAEDVSGGSFIYSNYVPLVYDYDMVQMEYYSPNLVNRPITITNKSKNILRTDRLPTSDVIDGEYWDTVASILQQNNNFYFYEIGKTAFEYTTPPTETGAEQQTPDIEGLSDSNKVFESFGCENMVPLDCYQGFGNNFSINENCEDKDAVKNGCYVFIRVPVIDLLNFKDFRNYAEWSYRFRFFFGVCRGVISETFTNNWINGTLFAFPIQADTYFDNNNLPYSKYSRELIYFDEKTNNFYYRSSPYNGSTNEFIGKDVSEIDGSVNNLNLLFPNTVIDLGMKDSFYGEIIFEPYTRGYIMNNLESTSYGDTSDLINFFVISRIINSTFLKQFFRFKEGAIETLFSRNSSNILNRSKARLDGDITQLLSINSEVGLIKFSPEFYEIVPGDTNPPAAITGTEDDPAVAVWFSSTTSDLQFKDFITPGRINLRSNNDQFNFPSVYGIKSQRVPFYSWSNTETNNIFGTQKNNWLTDSSGIITEYYQSLDRTKPPYFQSLTSPNTNDLYQRGYIFSVDSQGNYSTVRQQREKYLVGAPFHFYFGINKGESALDRFKTKYLADE